MQRQLTDEDRAFQQEMREFFTTKVPEDIRSGWIKDGEVDPDVMRRAQRLLNEEGS